jgi:hypothetical protein
VGAGNHVVRSGAKQYVSNAGVSAVVCAGSMDRRGRRRQCGRAIQAVSSVQGSVGRHVRQCRLCGQSLRGHQRRPCRLRTQCVWRGLAHLRYRQPTLLCITTHAADESRCCGMLCLHCTGLRHRESAVVERSHRCFVCESTLELMLEHSCTSDTDTALVVQCSQVASQSTGVNDGSTSIRNILTIAP